MTSAMVDPPAVTVRVPAKVNLELIVGSRRDDGFHPLSTVYQAVGIHDDVTVEQAPDWGVTVLGPLSEDVPTDDSNLGLRAARALARARGRTDPIHLTIRKEIPVAGGMAGGSADAAAALLACEQFWELDAPREELEEIAADLGSDVPFLLHGGTAIGSGRGELIAPVLARGTFHWVFALASAGLSTPAVYAEFDRIHERDDLPDPEPSPALMSALRTGDPAALAPLLSNDLQEAAISLRPELGEVLSQGLAYGALGGIVSGSGPTVAFLAAGHEAAIDLAVSLTASGTAPDVRRATGPAAGAHVLSVPRID